MSKPSAKFGAFTDTELAMLVDALDALSPDTEDANDVRYNLYNDAREECQRRED